MTRKIFVSVILAVIVLLLVANTALAAGGPSMYKCKRSSWPFTCKTRLLDGNTRMLFYGSTVYGPDGGGLSTWPYGFGWVRVQ